MVSKVVVLPCQRKTERGDIQHGVRILLPTWKLDTATLMVATRALQNDNRAFPRTAEYYWTTRKDAFIWFAPQTKPRRRPEVELSKYLTGYRDGVKFERERTRLERELKSNHTKPARQKTRKAINPSRKVPTTNGARTLREVKRDIGRSQAA